MLGTKCLRLRYCTNSRAIGSQAEGVDGDIGQAFQWLRKRGIAKATSMADRSANEGELSLSCVITVVVHLYCRLPYNWGTKSL